MYQTHCNFAIGPELQLCFFACETSPYFVKIIKNDPVECSQTGGRVTSTLWETLYKLYIGMNCSNCTRCTKMIFKIFQKIVERATEKRFSKFYRRWQPFQRLAQFPRSKSSGGRPGPTVNPLLVLQGGRAPKLSGSQLPPLMRIAWLVDHRRSTSAWYFSRCNQSPWRQRPMCA